jgi:hypothetical protein
MSTPGQASEHDADHGEANEGGGEDVPLAARDLLACIVALRVKRGAPF